MTTSNDDDQRFVAAFEDASLPVATFRHADHVRLAWLYLRDLPAAAALARFSAGLQRLAAANGVPDKYHETITWAFIVLIHERMERGGRAASWDAFRGANPDLFERGVLLRYYREETLASPIARRVFVLPDRDRVTDPAAPAPAERSPH